MQAVPCHGSQFKSSPHFPTCRAYDGACALLCGVEVRASALARGTLTAFDESRPELPGEPEDYAGVAADALFLLGFNGDAGCLHQGAVR